MTPANARVFPFGSPEKLDVDPEHARLREHDPVPRVRLPLGGEAYLVSRYADVRRVFADPVFSRAEASKPEAAALRPAKRNPYLIVSMDPPEHTRVRKLLASAFTMRAVQRLQPRIEEIAGGLVASMVAAGPPADFVAAFAAPLPAMVISELVGAPAEDHERLRGWMDTALSITSRTAEQVRTAGEHMVGYLGALIAAKRAEPADDLLTALIEAHDGGDRLCEPELVFTTYILLVGGYETTAGLLANGLLTLHRHPDQLALLRARPELVTDAVEELLRYVPIAKAGLERVATEDVTLSGVRVPAGATVVPLQYSANHDPELAADADRFDISRGPLPHLAFGHGIHHCIGAQLARLELRIAFDTLLRRLPELRPAVPDDAIGWKAGMLTRGPATLPVTW